jgi:hypothetical protein
MRVQVQGQVAVHREELEEVHELLKGWAVTSMQGEILKALGKLRQGLNQLSKVICQTQGQRAYFFVCQCDPKGI